MIYLRGIYLRLAGVVTLAVMLALALNAYLSQRTFERVLAPEVAKKVVSVGASIRSLVLRAVELGVPFHELYGVTEGFDEVREEAPEIAYLAITDTDGKVLHERMKAPSGATEYMLAPRTLALVRTPNVVPPPVRLGSQYMVTLPIVAAGEPLGLLHLGIDVRFVSNMVLDMLLDVIVVLVVSLFFTLELLHYIAGVKLDASLRTLGETFARGAEGDFRTPYQARGEHAFGSLMQLLRATLARTNQSFAVLARAVEDGRRVPAHERAPGLSQAQAGVTALAQRYKFGRESDPPETDPGLLAKVRAPLFVFILAEELTRSFLPAYVHELLVPLPGISPQLVLGLPIALFMLIVAIGQPFFGLWCERLGHGRTMLIGGAVAAVGFLGSALAVNVLDLLGWRSLCGLGYGMVFVAAQSYVLDHAPPTQRASSFAVFVGAIMAAGVCGPSIGGILADNIGMRPTFALAGLLAVASLVVMRGLPDSRPATDSRPPMRMPSLGEIGALLTNRNFMLVTGLAAMPAKILLTGMCFYLVPLYVLTVESTQAMSGRILMTYGAVMVVVAPLTAALAVTRERMCWLVGGGLIVSGLGGALLLAGASVGWVFAAVVLVGIGQSLSISAQSALVAEHCPAEIARMGDGIVYGVYRLLERLGNALGPIIAAVLVLCVGYRSSFVVIGCAVALAGAAFIVATRRQSAQALAPV
ncbi:MAG TPA: MFS transporter [Burkholderiaceae bacterium]|nr:MFS transporter [Burkholderiaceae bacterium]